MVRLALAVFAAVVALNATPAHAQLAGFKHVLTVPGAANTAGGLSTYVQCTNGNTSNAMVGIEVYGAGGAYIAGNSIAMGPNATVTFGTDVASGFATDVVVAAGPFKGHVRVVTDSGTKIVCSAWLAETTSNPAEPISSLQVVKKFSQK